VTWDGFQARSFGKQEEEEKRREGVFFVFGRKIGRTRGICDRKSQTLF